MIWLVWCFLHVHFCFGKKEMLRWPQSLAKSFVKDESSGKLYFTRDSDKANSDTQLFDILFGRVIFCLAFSGTCFRQFHDVHNHFDVLSFCPSVDHRNNLIV